MAKSSVFVLKNKIVKKFIITSLLSCITVGLCSQAEAIAASKADKLSLEASQLAEQGQYEASLQLWEEALKHYKKKNQQKEIAEITIEIAQAQRGNGQGVSACVTLQQYLKAEQNLCIPANGITSIQAPRIGSTSEDAIIAINFAQVIKDFGLFEPAKHYAEAAIASAEQHNYSEIIPDLAILNANIDLFHLMFDRDQLLYRETTNLPTTDAEVLIKRFSGLFNAYEQQFQSSLQLEAQLKWLATYQELLKQTQLFRNKTLTAYPKSLKSEYLALLQDLIRANDLDPFSPAEQLRLKFDIARILHEADKNNPDTKLQSASYQWTQDLVESAQAINHQPFLASGYALLAQQYQFNGQIKPALQAYHRASNNSNITHPRYQWQYEMAKLFYQLGEESQAERFYTSAIALIDEAQWNISPLAQSVKTNFQESVRPIFDDYIQLQLNQPQPDFSRILKLRNRYIEKVLENYLGCTIPEPIKIEAIKKVDPDAALVSIFKTNNQYITILENNGQFDVSKTDSQQIDDITQQLAFNFAGENQKYPIQTLNQLYQQLYQKLIKPIKGSIKSGQTILFVNLQPELQRIPMALMFDGSQYLIQQNPIALVGNTLYKPQKLSPSKNNILFAGLTQAPENSKLFADIPFVQQESITIDPQKVLLNKNFTTSKFSKLVQRDFQIVHLATHGQFSSNPNQTYLAAWNENINLSVLTELVETRKNTASPIELLILSACETAKGDRLAALGMAGISIQAGARSTLASLWKAIDESSPFFMGRFYSHLEAGETKATALQLAQIDMIEEQYPPYSWGTYILTGSWF